MQLCAKFYEAESNVFLGSFNYFPTNILRDIYAHTHRVSYGGIKKTTACSESPPKEGK